MPKEVLIPQIQSMSLINSTEQSQRKEEKQR